MSKMRGRILIPLPNTGAMLRKRNNFYMRSIIIVALCIFVLLQYHNFNYLDSRDSVLNDMSNTNDSVDAILSMVPSGLHKFLTPRSRNHTVANAVNSQLLPNGSSGVVGGNVSNLSAAHVYFEVYHPPNISEIKRQIAKYNDKQLLLNEDIFGPLQNDSVIIVIQVHKRITYLRHLIVSLAQARDISKTLLIFSHDFYDEDINDLVQQIDFCKVMQIFYPYSIQTHPYEFPGVDPNDCPRDIKKDQAMIMNCNNALYPDLHGHYRVAKFTQIKHHWWFKANRIFNELEVTRYHTGLVLFLEEDHYVAEDFLYVLEMMQKRTKDLCPHCNVLSLGTYLKTFNYYTYHSKTNKKSYASSLISSNNLLGYNRNRNSLQLSSSKMSSSSSSYASSSSSSTATKTAYVGDTDPQISSKQHSNSVTASSISSSSSTDKNGVQTWGYHVLPSLYSVYQKVRTRVRAQKLDRNRIVRNYREVELLPWSSNKHNMGFAFNRSTWSQIQKCALHFCSYDDYNWDWTLQHVSHQCMRHKLQAMIVKGPRVFHIGECGIHHKNKNCESNQVISKVQHVLRIARKSGQLFPRSLTLTVASIVKKIKLGKGNGGWADRRDHELCMNMTLPIR